MYFLKFLKMLFQNTHFEVCPSQVKTANNLATRKINMRSEQRVYIFLKGNGYEACTRLYAEIKGFLLSS